MSIVERRTSDVVDLYWHEAGHPNGSILLLLHGLGANGAVWDEFREKAEAEWQGPIIIPDFRGHGRSSRAAVYTFGQFASDLALILPRGVETHVLGHSMGGAVGVLLASGAFGIDVRSVLALGVKLRWSEADLARMTSVAERGDRRFNTADEAARAALRSAGLSHVAEKAASVAKAGVQKTEDGTYVLGWDTQTCRVGAFPMVDVLRGKGGASMTFARGQDDEAVSSSEIRSLGCDPIDIPGAGHNAHVEKPDAVWALFSQTQRQA